METTDRTVAAEARFVEEGHRAILGHDHRGHFVRIVSETLGHAGKGWKVRAAVSGPGLPVAWSCAPDGPIRDGHLPHGSVGRTACKHMAGAARRLERAGLVELVTVEGERDAQWLATEKACPVPAPAPADDGPFAAFSGMADR
jgi:hypothetical protein